MSKRLIIVTNSANATKSSRDAITFHLESMGWPAWHWFEDIWLVANVPDEVGVSALRDAIRALPAFSQSNPDILIFPIKGVTDHSGFLSKDAIPWLKQYW